MLDALNSLLPVFRALQPVEKKIVLDILSTELGNEAVECTYCGRRIKNPVWLSNLPLCPSCHSHLFSVREKMRLVQGKDKALHERLLCSAEDYRTEKGEIGRHIRGGREG